jgi:hypothetical protein
MYIVYIYIFIYIYTYMYHIYSMHINHVKLSTYMPFMLRFPHRTLIFTMTSQVTQHRNLYASSDFEMPDEYNVMHRVSIPSDCATRSMSRRYADTYNFVARGTPGAHMVYIGTGNSGAQGITTTKKNICQDYYKTGSCTRSREKCKYYHMRIGRIASALPGLDYHDMGDLNAAGRSTPHLADQLEWSMQDRYGKAQAFQAEQEASNKRAREWEAELDEEDHHDELQEAMKKRYAILEERAAKREADAELRRNVPPPSFRNISAITYAEPAPITPSQGDAPDPNPEGLNEPEAEASCVKAEPIDAEANPDSTIELEADDSEADDSDSVIDGLLHQPMDGQVDVPGLIPEGNPESPALSPSTPPLAPVSPVYSLPGSPNNDEVVG